jgi:hypothetical protein
MNQTSTFGQEIRRRYLYGDRFQLGHEEIPTLKKRLQVKQKRRRDARYGFGREEMKFSIAPSDFGISLYHLHFTLNYMKMECNG